MKHITKRVAAGILAFAATAGFATAGAAADNCTVYSGPNGTGQSVRYDLPAAGETFDVQGWGASSVRRSGAMLKNEDPAVYKNGESIVITAHDSPVVLYTFMGDNFDGKFQAVSCEEGTICHWTYGSMKNKIQSFTCQRDYPLNGPNDLAQLYDYEIPTAPIAQQIATELDHQLEASSKIKSSKVKYARLRWTNVFARCARTGVGCGEVDGWQAKYRDALEFNFKSELDLKPPSKNYDVWINFWFRPQLTNGVFKVQEMWWQVTVEGGAYSKRILDNVVDGVKPVFQDGDGVDDIGKTVTDAIYSQIVAKKGKETADSVFGTGDLPNRSVIFSHTCNFDQQELDTPGVNYTNAQKSAVCGSTTPEWAIAPVLRIVKGF